MNINLLNNFYQQFCLTDFFWLSMFPKSVVTSVTLYGYKQIDDSLSLEGDSIEEKDSKVQPQLPDMSGNLSIQIDGHIRSLSIGSSHVLFLTDTERVFSIGSNQFGQRGAQATNASVPTIIKEVEGVTQISCGLYHSVCLDNKKKVYTWGRGSEGQLGLGDVDFSQDPVMLSLSVGAIQICCGGSHTLILCEDGSVYACGDDTWGQLGLGGSHTTKSRPTKIDWFVEQGIKVAHIQGGLEHSLFLSTENKLYSCGNNLFSQCGLEGVSNVSKPTQVQIPFQQGETITNIYASMGTFSAVLTSRSNIYVWGTGSWGHARKPTSIQDLCHFDGIPKFSSILMGDNYALIHDIKQYLIFGSNKLPDLGSQQPIQKLRCEVLKINSQALKVQLGYKLMVVVDKEQMGQRRASASEVKQDATSSQSIYQRISHSRNSSNQHSQRYSLESAKESKPNDSLQKTLTQTQCEVHSLKRELDLCKSQMKQKDQLILELQNSIQKHQLENSKLQSASKAQSCERVKKEITPNPSPKPSPRILKNDRRPSISVTKVEPPKVEIVRAEPLKADYQRQDYLQVNLTKWAEQTRTDQSRSGHQRVENQREVIEDQARVAQTRVEQARAEQTKTDQIRTDISKTDQARVEKPKNDQSRSEHLKSDYTRTEQARSEYTRPELTKSEYAKPELAKTTTGNENLLYVPSPHTGSYTSNHATYNQQSAENTKKPYKPADIQTEDRKSSSSTQHYADMYKSGKQALQPSNVLGSSFEYKTYEKLRLMGSSEKKEESGETRIKKIEEGQFSLSRYNMKSIRSITPYDLRNLAPYQSNTSMSELRKSSAGPDINSFKPYERYLEGDRSSTPECQAIIPEYSHKRTHTNTNERYYRDTYTPLPPSTFLDAEKHQINTSIIDKICNYQRVVVSKIVGSGNQPVKADDRSIVPKFALQETKSDKKTKQSPYGGRGHANCDGTYSEQFNSICQTQEPQNPAYENISHYLNKQYEDFYKLRG